MANEEGQHLQLIRAAWDAYHADYMAYHLREWPDFHEHFASGGTMLDEYVVEAMGDVRGLRLLDICCACDAKQAFSWANLGATVTACDISPRAIEIAWENARRIGLDVEFRVADAQTLEPIPDGAFDIVFATYLSWFEDLLLAFRNWARILRPGGKLLVHTLHPVTFWLDEIDGQVVAEHAYGQSGSVETEFTGSDLADRHGGWNQRFPCVEFHHTVADVINALASAGFGLEFVREEGRAGPGSVLSGMPSHIVLVGLKPDDAGQLAQSVGQGDVIRCDVQISAIAPEQWCEYIGDVISVRVSAYEQWNGPKTREQRDLEASAWLRKWVERGDPALFVAKREGQVVGYLSADERERGMYYMSHIGVRHDLKRQGIGRALIRACEKAARERGYRALTTTTYNRYKGMLFLLLSEGFCIRGTTWVEGAREPRICLRKELK